MGKYSEENMLAEYKTLTSQRDASYAKVAPLKEKLDTVNALTEKYRQEAADLAGQIGVALGAEHLVLKKEIASLARALSRKDGPLSTQ